LHQDVKLGGEASLAWLAKNFARCTVLTPIISAFGLQRSPGNPVKFQTKSLPFPRAWVLRAHLRRIDRDYRQLIAQAKGDERENLIAEHLIIRDVEGAEELASIQTSRLCNRASRYYIDVPEIHWKGHDFEDEHWVRGPQTGRWFLKPTAGTSLQRQIEEAKKRRREAWEAWAKILGNLIT
jgi:hypothetical protein